jgi:hypothetical protein
VFYSTIRQRDRQVAVSKRETYTYRKNHWVCKTATLTDEGGRLVGYIMKSAEAYLRRVLRCKHSITAGSVKCDLGKLSALGISVPEAVEAAAAEFYAAATRKTVSVDAGNLSRIRLEAAGTREKLLAPEGGSEGEAPSADALSMGGVASVKPPYTAERAPDTPGGRVSAVEKGGWGGFIAALTRAEIGALSAALRAGNIGEIARAEGVMPEVLADGINEKATDFLGDVVLEFDGAARVYEDYREKLLELVIC